MTAAAAVITAAAAVDAEAIAEANAAASVLLRCFAVWRVYTVVVCLTLAVLLLLLLLACCSLMLKEARIVETKWVEQPLDHFDPLFQTEGHTWQQRYFEALSPQHQQQQQEHNIDPRPIFVYIGGEAELTEKDITAGVLLLLPPCFRCYC